MPAKCLISRTSFARSHPAPAAIRRSAQAPVILHPDDFAELQDSSELLDDLVAGPELSDLGMRAHQMVESPEGELIDSEASVRRLLGL